MVQPPTIDLLADITQKWKRHRLSSTDGLLKCCDESYDQLKERFIMVSSIHPLGIIQKHYNVIYAFICVTLLCWSYACYQHVQINQSIISCCHKVQRQFTVLHGETSTIVNMPRCTRGRGETLIQRPLSTLLLIREVLNNMRLPVIVLKSLIASLQGPERENNICEHLFWKEKILAALNGTLFCLGGPIILTDLHNHPDQSENNSTIIVCMRVRVLENKH